MAPKAIFTKYLKDIADVAGQGDAREESFYPALAAMLNEVALESGKKDVRVTVLPRPTEGGNPDFRLWNGSNQIGYIEAKKPTDLNLNAIEQSEQLKRYLNTFPNLILTNFLEFRLYRRGEPVGDSVSAGRPDTLNRLGVAPPLESEVELYALLDRFLNFALPPDFTADAESLAVELAKRTRLLRDVTIEEMRDVPNSSPDLSGFFDAFRSHLIGSLTPEEFADMFAQTITYGLFAARVRTGDDFNRGEAVDNIPHTIGILRRLFRFVSHGDLPDQLAWCVDDIAEVLAVADAPGILNEYYRDGKGGDPIVHFYETFLAQYDPRERERRGVYYTPEPVVGYIVRSLNEILKTEFDMGEGLASEGVTLLDPAAGTMTFVACAAQLAVSEFESRLGSGVREEFIRSRVLKSFFAFELMMAPYTVGHLKMSLLLQELGHRLADDERMPFYLTNTLDWEKLEQTRIPGLSALAEESRLANDVKKQTPILCILGNPPYSGHSSNQGDWIRELIEDYKQVDGKPLGERNPKWLQNDYVKFLRFAQWKIEQSGRGIVGMITDRSYLESATFRGMRRSMMGTYDDIYILDLHGDSVRGEINPTDGRPDGNIFEIRQGVAIAFFIKTGNKAGGDCRVHHAEEYGSRDLKYGWLESHDHSSTSWQQIYPLASYYFFTPRDVRLESAFRRFASIRDVFISNSVGIVTARDRLTIGWSDQEVWNTVRVFSGMDPELARETYKLGRDAQDWKVTVAQNDLREHGLTRDNVVPILYRPFDVRYTYYTGQSGGFICRPRTNVMSHMLLGDNLAICIGRQGHVVGDGEWDLIYCSKTIEDFNLFYRGGNVNFPLFQNFTTGERRSNLNRGFTDGMTDTHRRIPSPEDVFYYIYAVLHSPVYRSKPYVPI